MPNEKTEDGATMKPGRRRFIAGAATGSLAAVVAVIGDSIPAEAAIGSVKKTPITDTLTNEEAAWLTPAARALTEYDVIRYNYKVHGYNNKGDAPNLAVADVKSLERAFTSRDRRLYGIAEVASRAPNMVSKAHANSVSCCCCPASCCCAAVGSKAIRTRRVIA